MTKKSNEIKFHDYLKDYSLGEEIFHKVLPQSIIFSLSQN